MADQYTREDAIEDGRKTAEANVSEEDQAVRERNEKRRTDTLEDARETAELNRKAGDEGQPESDSGTLKNDTSKTAKQNTAKSQLDPAGVDPISASEVNKSATDASMDTGNKTAVSNEEVARRSQDPGKAEEEAPLSTAGDGVEDTGVSEAVARPNKHQKADKS